MVYIVVCYVILDVYFDLIFSSISKGSSPTSRAVQCPHGSWPELSLAVWKMSPFRSILVDYNQTLTTRNDMVRDPLSPSQIRECVSIDGLKVLAEWVSARNRSKP